MMMFNNMNKVVPVLSTKKDIPSDLTGIVQADISMCLPNYPCLCFLLVGVRVECQASGQKYSGREVVDVLFQANNFGQFLELADQLQSRVWPPGAFQPEPGEGRHRIEIVSQDQMNDQLSKVEYFCTRVRELQKEWDELIRGAHGSQRMRSDRSVRADCA